MDIDGLPLIGSGVDFTQVEALNHKRTLAFINHFITSTTSFLNKFSRSCEIRLQECENRIQKLEAAILILETKLSSIPGLEETPVQIKEIPVVDANPDTEVPKESLPAVPEAEQSKEETTDVSQSPNMIPVSEDPVLKRFFKMLQFGVPEPAVKQKMTQEGIDPNLLRNPNQLVPARSKAELLSDSEESHPGD